MQLDDSLYLGDRWEYRIRRGDFIAKAHGTSPLAPGPVWCEIPPESVWVFSATSQG
jgi:iron(III) transport system ATP-binding protein